MVISLTNLKGGCGKSTLSINVAVGLSRLGYSVCLVDTDLEQRTSIEWSESREADQEYIPVIGKTVKQLIKDVIQLKKDYDIIVVDSVPQLSELAEKTILLSDIILIPCKTSLADFNSLKKFTERYKKIQSLKEQAGMTLKSFVVVNEANKNTNAYKDTVSGLEAIGETVLHTLGSRIAYKDALMYGLGVQEYEDKKAVSEMDELITKLKIEIDG